MEYFPLHKDEEGNILTRGEKIRTMPSCWNHKFCIKKVEETHILSRNLVLDFWLKFEKY